MGWDEMTLNSLPVQRLFKLVASWFTEALSCDCSVFKVCPSSEAWEENSATTSPFPHPQSLHLRAACPALKLPVVDFKGLWNLSPTVRPWNKLLCPSGPQFLIFNLFYFYFTYFSFFLFFLGEATLG